MRACFACGRKLGRNPTLADTRDGQTAFVGSECWKLIKKAGEAGYQPLRGGPKLWCVPPVSSQSEIEELFKKARRGE